MIYYTLSAFIINSFKKLNYICEYINRNMCFANTMQLIYMYIDMIDERLILHLENFDSTI